MARRWNEADLDFIRTNWKEMCDDELAEELGRATSAVARQRQGLGLLREKNGGYNWSRWPNGNRFWTFKEDQIIMDNCRTMTDNQLKGLLPGRSASAIRMRRASALGIRKGGYNV